MIAADKCRRISPSIKICFDGPWIILNFLLTYSGLPRYICTTLIMYCPNAGNIFSEKKKPCWATLSLFFMQPFLKEHSPAGIWVLALRVERGRESSDKFKSLCLFKPWQSQTNWHNRPCKVKIFFVCLSVGDTNPVSKRLWPFKRKMWAKSINKFSF